MKKIIILSFLFLVIPVLVKATTPKRIIIKSREKTDPRNSIPVDAYLDDSSLLIDFKNETQPSLTINNIETGEVIYEENQQTQQSTFIDLSNEEIGIYKIEITLDGELYCNHSVYTVFTCIFFCK